MRGLRSRYDNRTTIETGDAVAVWAPSAAAEVHHRSRNTKLEADMRTTPRLFRLRSLRSSGENEKMIEGGNLAHPEALEVHHWSRNTREGRDPVVFRVRATGEYAGVECPRGDSEPSEIVNLPAGMGGRALVNAGNSITTTRAHSDESYGSEPSGVGRLGENDLAQCSANRHAANTVEACTACNPRFQPGGM